FKKEQGGAEAGENEGEDDDDVTVDLLLEQAKQSTTKPVFIADDFFTYTIPLSK
ncbi:unnamed protein product, partial [Adineta steineri]